MLARHARKELRQIRDDLLRLESVPDTARRFHRRRGELLARVTARLKKRWMFWIPAQSLDKLRAQLMDLNNLAQPVSELTSVASRLEEEVDAILRRCRGIGEKEPLQSWIEERAGDWGRVLGRVGGASDREADIRLLLEHLRELKGEVNRHQQAVELLLRAEHLVERFSSSPRRAMKLAPLKADLPKIRQRLFDEGPTHGWLEELRQRIRIPETETPSVEIRQLRDLRKDLPEWARLLGQRKDQVEEWMRRGDNPTVPLEERDSEEIESLEQSGRELLSKLRETADEKRRTTYEGLERLLADLESACGRQPEELHRKLDELEFRETERPVDYERWLKEAPGFEQHLEDQAEAHHHELRERLESWADTLETELDGLRERLLSRDLRERRDELEAEVRQQLKADDTLGLLTSLRKLGRLEEAVRDLQRQANEESAAVERSQEELIRRHRLLLRAASKLKFEVEDLEPQLEALRDSPPNPRDLEAVRSVVEQLSERHREQHRLFMDHCREQIRRHLDQVRHVSESLAAAEIDEPPVEEITVGPESSPAEAVARLHRARDIETSLRERLAAELERLDHQREELSAQLEALDSSAIPAADVDYLTHLRRDLASSGDAEEEDPIALLSRLHASNREAQGFLRRLAEPGRRVSVLREELRGRIRRMKNLLRYPELAGLLDRVTAWTLAAPDEPDRWPESLQQLQEASALLDRAERHGRRLAAAELVRAVETLRAFQHRSGDDGGARKEITETLERLEECGNRRLPPVALRSKVVELARRLDPKPSVRG